MTDQRMPSFRAADMTDAAVQQQILVLDQIAADPGVRALKAWALAQLDPRPGEHALDIGSGTGEDAGALARAVGPSGRAVGLEFSSGLRAEAARRAASSDLAVEFIDGDAHALPFDDAALDCVRCERVFQHLSDPPRAAAEIARVLRPGGRVVLIDSDWGTAIAHPGEEIVDLAGAVIREQIANPHSGRLIRGQLAACGLDIVDTTGAVLIQPQEAATRPPASILGTQAAALGVISADDAVRLAQLFVDAAGRGDFHLSVTMFAVAAVKR